jgi:hypothetical protein
VAQAAADSISSKPAVWTQSRNCKKIAIIIGLVVSLFSTAPGALAAACVANLSVDM